MPISTNDLRQMAVETAKERSDAAQVFALLYIGDQLGDLAHEVSELAGRTNNVATEISGLQPR